MQLPGRATSAVAVAVTVAAAVYVVSVRLEHGWLPSNDLYAYFLPNILYAVSSWRSGWQGLLWNPFQNCGQPFLGISTIGLLYPPYWLFLVLDAQQALRAVEILHLIIGGLGAYGLVRELGGGVSASLGGALAFEMGNTMLGLTNWTPIHSAPYAWMPVALLCCERLLKQPSAGRGLALTATVAIALLPGMPQIVFFTYQIIALRALVQLVTRSWAAARAVLVALPLALLLPFLLVAVQFLPSAETAGESIRSRLLTATDLYPFGRGQSGAMSMAILLRSLGQPFMLIPCMLVGPALCAPATRRQALFYSGVGLLYVGLSFGPGTPLFDLYTKLPLGGTFRDPVRFFWVSGFCLAITAGLGCAALNTTPQLGRAGQRVMLLLMTLPPILLLWLAHAALSLPAAVRGGLDLVASGPGPLRMLLPPGSPSPWEWLGIVMVLLAAVLARHTGRTATVAAWAAMGALLAQLLGAPGLSTLYHFPKLPPLFANAGLLDTLRQSLSAQDRLYLVHEAAASTEFAFMAKTPSLFRVPSILDYEALISARYADLSMILRTGKPPRNLNDFNLRGPEPAPGFNRRLLDLTAVRFVVVPESRVASMEHIEPRLPLRFTADGINVYENPLRFPRAFYVPRIEVVADPQALLDRLANGPLDLRQVALVEEPPPTRFLGERDAPGQATVAFVRNDPEHVVLRVQAPARGFLVLTDQYFPGWLATVDGQSTPILRANYAFRLIEVPAGELSVELRYRPRSVWLGALISAVTVVVVMACYVRSRPAARPVRW